MNKLNKTQLLTIVNSVLKDNSQIKSITDITDALKTMSICVGKICLVPEGNAVVQYYNESTTGLYLTEWNKGPGKLLRIDMRDLLRDKYPDPYFKYIEVITPTEKYLIRLVDLLTAPEGEFDKLESLNLIHGVSENLISTIIKNVGINESYAAKQVRNDTDIDEALYIEDADNTNSGIEDESDVKLECVQLFD